MNETLKKNSAAAFMRSREVQKRLECIRNNFKGRVITDVTFRSEEDVIAMQLHRDDGTSFVIPLLKVTEDTPRDDFDDFLEREYQEQRLNRIT